MTDIKPRHWNYFIEICLQAFYFLKIYPPLRLGDCNLGRRKIHYLLLNSVFSLRRIVHISLRGIRRRPILQCWVPDYP